MTVQPNHHRPANEHRLAEDHQALQHALAELGLHDLQRRWLQQPDRHYVPMGGGNPAEVSFRGNPEDAFHGIVVYNPTGRDVFIGFNVKASIGAQMYVPAEHMLVLPTQFSNFSISVSAGDAAGGEAENVTILKLRYPPEPFLADLGAHAASTIVSQTDVTVKGASVKVVPANPFRRGLEIENRGEKAVRLVLGEEAAANKGLYLAAATGTWNGIISQSLWLGSVFAICEAGETNLAVVEA